VVQVENEELLYNTRHGASRILMRWVVELRGNLAVERPPVVLALANLPTTVPPGS
jgi:hypothetical protein